MYPAEGVQDVLRYVLGVDAVDRVAHVLPGRYDQAERDQDQHGDRVVQAEHRRIDVHVADFDQGLQAAEDIQHGTRGAVGSGSGFVAECPGHPSEDRGGRGREWLAVR